MRIDKGIKKILSTIRVIVCAFIVWISYQIAVFLRLDIFHGTDSADMTGRNVSIIVLLYGLIIGIVISVLRNGREYIGNGADNAYTSVFLITVSGILLIILFLYLAREMEFSRVVLFLFWLVSTILLELEYVVERFVIIKHWDKFFTPQRIIIVGNGNGARKYKEAIDQQVLRTGVVVGYIGYPKKNMDGCLGHYEELNRILEDENPDRLVVALEPHEMRFMTKVLEAAEKEGINVHLIPFFNEYYPKNPVTETVGDVNLVDLRSTPLGEIKNSIVKRLFDICGSIVLILLFSPLMLITAILVKLSSPGPVLFKQERVGKDKKIFRMLKFRSMRVNDKQDTAWSTDADPRRTVIGSFLRKYSIDELPQLFNVLVGDMSLVGPRPEIPFYVRQFKETVPLYLVRQQVRPGMTGWAQVHGLRGDTSIEDRVEYDIWYIENWSLILDIRILFMTVFGGFINNEH